VLVVVVLVAAAEEEEEEEEEESSQRKSWITAWRDLQGIGWKVAPGDHLSNFVYATPEGNKLKKRERMEGFHFFRTKAEVLELFAVGQRRPSSHA
jgi:hypothetical protein